MSTPPKEARPRSRRWPRIPLAVAIPVAVVLAGGAAWAFWSALSTAGGNGASSATSVNAGATPTASATAGSVTVSWSPSALATGQAVSGYVVKRYDAGTLALQTTLSGCSGTVATTSCVESPVPSGSWKYSITPRFATNWAGTESPLSATVNVDSTAPTNAVTVSNVSGAVWQIGSTVYYAGGTAGSFTLTNAVADAGTGPASSQTSALTGTTTGWSHTPSTVSLPSGGPYVSNAFAWSAGTSSSPTEVVTGRDVAGNTATTTLGFVNDSTAPSGSSISYANGYQSGKSVAVSFVTGTDAGSGISTRQLQRAAAPLTAGVCGAYSGYVNVGPNNPTSVYTDTAVFNATCYVYRYVVTDFVGNQQIATSANVAKVDYAGAVSATSGVLSYWRLGEASASLTDSDTFTAADASSLTSHTTGTGATWNFSSGTSGAELISANRAYRTASAVFYENLYSSATPASADYAVEADLYYKGALTGDAAGVIARVNTATGAAYQAKWESNNTWAIEKFSGSGSPTVLSASSVQPNLTVGETYRVRLEVSGSSSTLLKLYVNGVLWQSYTDASSPYTAAGKAGISDGSGTATIKSSTTGLHIDNFQVAALSYPRAADSTGSNTGDYKNGVSLAQAGALPADPNTAAQFDGVNDYVQMAGTTGIPVGATARSTELWFKTSSAARQVLFSYGTGGNNQQYGLWIDAGGATMTAWGYGTGNDRTFTMPAAVNNGAWHQAILTYDGTQLTLYIDGVGLPAQAATRSTVMGMYGFVVGAILNSADGNYGGWFNGSIDEVSFYTTALSQATVTNHYQLGSSAGADLTGPTGGSVDATGLVGTGARYSTSTTLSIALNKGSDTSGVAATGATLTRATAPLTSAGGTANGVCGTYGSYSLVTGGTDPSSPKSDTVSDQACYRYQYTVSDTLGNATTYTSGDIKVDTTAPAAPTLGFSAPTNSYWSGSVLYYNSAAASGSFTVTGTSTDAVSGIASYGYPSLGANWTSTPGAIGVNTYSWSGAPAAPGTVNVSATSNASGVSASTPFTMTSDTTAPSAGTVSYTNGSAGGTSVSVSFTTGTDAGSGIGTRLLQRASAPVTGITCGAYGAFATIAGGTNPTSPVADTIAADTCDKYQYVVSDNVGNTQTATSSNVAHTPFGTIWTLDEGTGTSAADTSGNGNTATLQGAVGWTAHSGHGSSVSLTGASGTFVDSPNPVIDTGQSYTVAAWVKLNVISGFQTITSLDGTNISPFYLQLGQSAVGQPWRLRFAQVFSDSTSSTSADVYGPTPVAGTWYHVAGTYNKTTGTTEFFVNGVSQGTAVSSGSWTATGHTVIGRAKYGGASVDWLNGAVDDVRYYDRVLSASEIAALAQ